MHKLNYVGLLLVVLAATFCISCSTDSKTLKLSSSKLDFGDVNLGDFVKLDVVLTNKYNTDLIISDFLFSNSSIFSFTSGNTLPIYLAKNDTHTLSIQFTPIAGGQIVETLSIFHDASTKAKMLNLKGNGVPVARMLINAKSQDFKLVLINTPATFDFDITNTGTADLNISNLNFMGTGANAYSITAGGLLPIVVPISTIHTITVQFKPPADIPYNAELSIIHDAVDETSPLVLTITGEGTIVKPEISLNQTSPWDFGTVPTSFPNMQNLEIENTGTDDLTVTSMTMVTGTVFSVDKVEDTNGNNVPLPAVIAPGVKIIATIKFEPPSTTTYNDTLTIVHDGTNAPSPLDMSLSGEGKTAVTQTFNYSGSIDSWTVPAGVTTVRIEAWGGQGGGNRSGKGARVRGDFIVTPGETLKILVAENGYVTNQGDYGAGGGGGSYVYRNATDNYPLIVAGGGGGQAQNQYGGNASDTETPVVGGGSGSGNGGTGGNGGDGGQNLYQLSTAGGGAGWLTDGKDGVYIRNPEGKGGQCPRNGATGGIFTHNTASYCTGTAGDGGFGGGGGMSDNSGAGGGGGGWNGGGGGNNYNSGTWGCGGGAGSYNGGTNKDGASGVQTGNGKVTITY